MLCIILKDACCFAKKQQQQALVVTSRLSLLLLHLTFDIVNDHGRIPGNHGID
jgi:hypothetical protein